MVSQPSADIRLYKDRASYSLRAALDIFREGKIAHVAFVHPGDEEGEGTKRRKETIMNIPLITVLVREGEDEDDQDSYVVYLHSLASSDRLRSLLVTVADHVNHIAGINTLDW